MLSEQFTVTMFLSIMIHLEYFPVPGISNTNKAGYVIHFTEIDLSNFVCNGASFFSELGL